MRTITLELLRHGPAHNQLLSPLTPYLALCENHAAVTLNVPFEHNQFLFRLGALDYKHSDESRIFQLKDTAKVIGDLLAMIPGLTAESNKEDNNKEQLTHLRLIISASELALLPFELAISPNGLPGAGQYLLLQPQLPLCLTREIRRVPNENFQWPKKLRILFVAAAPPEAGNIPLESHLLTLRRAIDPWIKFFDNDEMRQKQIEEHLVFLPEASIEAIEQKCSSEYFSHIHILAHGVEKKENYDTRFFLALHNAQNPNETDYISGQRLATALRVLNSQNSPNLARPLVVTLASCNSGSQGSVVGAGASIAHALHESGIPIVVAGQFPLSFKGSVRLVECLYDGLLWGKDPRWLLYDLRRRLFSQYPDTHDWASLTAYVSLPLGFDLQLSDIQIEQASQSMEAAMDYADKATGRYFKINENMPKEESRATTDKNIEEFLNKAQKKIAEAKKKLEILLEKIPEKSTKIHGLLASTEKRQAEIFYSFSKNSSAPLQMLLRSSRDHYWEAFQEDKSNSWAVVQYLSLALIIKKFNHLSNSERLYEQKEERPDRNLNSLWTLAYILSLNDLHKQDRSRSVWAHGNLIELNLLTLIMDRPPECFNIMKEKIGKENKPDQKKTYEGIDEEKVGGCAEEHAYTLIEIAGRGSFEVYSTRRQLMRYKNWYNHIAELGTLHKVIERVLDAFPEEEENRFQGFF